MTSDLTKRLREDYPGKELRDFLRTKGVSEALGLAFDHIDALENALADALERKAAQWHDERRRATPDVFEMELHNVCAAAIRALARPAPAEKPAAKEMSESDADNRSRIIQARAAEIARDYEP